MASVHYSGYKSMEQGRTFRIGVPKYPTQDPILGPCLRARSFSGQKDEAAVGVAVLNRMLDSVRPDSVRRLNIAA